MDTTLKSLGQIAYEAFTPHSTWESIAQAVLTAATHGAEWVLLPEGTRTRDTDEWLHKGSGAWRRCTNCFRAGPSDIIRRRIATTAKQEEKPFSQSAEVPAPYSCPWCVPGAGNCHHTEEEIAKAWEKAAEVGYSIILCCLCNGPVQEFSIPNEAWNRVIRKGGTETDKEYLCWQCFENKLQGAVLQRAEAAEARAKELEQETAALKAKQPRWIPVSERMPTEADANENGFVLQLLSQGGVTEASWRETSFAVAWMPIPKYTPPTPEELERQEFDRWVKSHTNPAQTEGEHIEQKAITWAAWRAAWQAARKGIAQ